MSIHREVGKNIVLLRTEKGITQEALSLQANVNTTYLHKIEHGLANPSLALLTRIADALNVPVLWLISPKSCPPESTTLPIK